MFHGHAMTPVLDEERAAELAEIFRLLGDANRLRIAVVCLGGPVCVGDIARQVELSASLVSHHLRLLRAARFVRSQKRGKKVFYGATDAHVRCIIKDMVDHVGKHCGAEDDEDGS
jgi:DNA-binding transcriptional ArsR family regulator